MALRRYTKDTVTSYTLLRKFLISNGAYVKFLKNLKDDLTMHPNRPFCSVDYAPIPDMLCGNFLANYVDYEITHVDMYNLINNAFSWPPTDEGHRFWRSMHDKWCLLPENFFEV